MSVLAFTVVCIFAANVLIIAAAVFGVRASLAAAGWEENGSTVGSYSSPRC